MLLKRVLELPSVRCASQFRGYRRRLRGDGGNEFSDMIRERRGRNEKIRRTSKPLQDNFYGAEAAGRII